MFDSRYYKILQDQILRDLTGFYPTKSYKILLYWARPKGYIVLGKFDYNIEIRPTKTTFHKKTWCDLGFGRKFDLISCKNLQTKT